MARPNMTEKSFLTFLYRQSAARLLVPFFALLTQQGALAAQEASEPQSQIVISAFPETEARQALVPDSSWSLADSRNFTGHVVVKSAFRQLSPARAYGAYVRFSPGARTHWHVHPLGQTLLIVDGTGLTQAQNPDGTLGSVVAVKAGDIVTCPPGIMHWHGASPEVAMTHMAISESDPNLPVAWKGAVDDKSYLEGASEAFGKGFPAH